MKLPVGFCPTSFQVSGVMFFHLQLQFLLFVCFRAVNSAHPECLGKCASNVLPCNDVQNVANCPPNFRCCLDASMFEGATRSFAEIDVKKEETNEDSTDDIHNSEEASEDRVTSDTYDKSLELSCPGTCLPKLYFQYCEYIIDSDALCNENTKCCVNGEQLNSFYGDNGDTDSDVPTETRTECPYSCVSSSLESSCVEILREYFCPDGFTCCSKVEAESELEHQPDVVQPIESPNSETLQLTFDEEGNVQVVDDDGQAETLETLVPENLRDDSYAPITEISLLNGKLIVFTDRSGKLYQHFISSEESQVQDEDSETHRVGREVPSYYEPESKQEDMVYKLEDQYPPEELNDEFWGNLEGNYGDTSRSGALEDNSEIEDPEAESAEDGRLETIDYLNIRDSEPSLSIGEESDEVKIRDETLYSRARAKFEKITQTMFQRRSVPLERMLEKPLCPGSCMSPFLIFACRGQNTIYDGFACQERAVCCVDKREAARREEYIKTVSPHLNLQLVSRAPSNCGKKSVGQENSEDFESKDSQVGEWCWQVAIISHKNQYMCSGALIDSSWVVTAAHCVAGAIQEKQIIYVLAGVTDLTDPDENEAGQSRKVLKTFVHHDHDSVSLDNDLALLHLEEPLTFNANVCLPCLPRINSIPSSGTKCIITGYGFPSKGSQTNIPGGVMSLKTHEARVEIIKDHDCMMNISQALSSPFYLPSSSFCAGCFDNRDVCQKDAGGPLVCKMGDTYQLIGVASWSYGCVLQNVPTVYTGIPPLLGWIDQKMAVTALQKSQGAV